MARRPTLSFLLICTYGSVRGRRASCRPYRDDATWLLGGTGESLQSAVKGSGICRLDAPQRCRACFRLIGHVPRRRAEWPGLLINRASRSYCGRAEPARQGELSYAARTSVLRPNAPRCIRDSARRRGTRAAYGGSSGISGGTPGGISAGISAGISGGTPGGISGGTPGGISACT